MSEPLTEPVPNLPLLRKVLEHVTAHPEEYDQGCWYAQSSELEFEPAGN